MKYAEIQNFVCTKIGDFGFVMLFEKEQVNFVLNVNELNEANSLFQRFFNFYKRTANYALVPVKCFKDKCIYFPKKKIFYLLLVLTWKNMIYKKNFIILN